jgi:hypothetical protein
MDLARAHVEADVIDGDRLAESPSQLAEGEDVNPLGEGIGRRHHLSLRMHVSKASTILRAATRPWAISRPSNTKGNTMA